jgi:hypothetical protein
MRRNLLLLALLAFLGCKPTVTPPPDTDLCAAMCQHIGPADAGGLGCAEGEPLYDSTKPGDAGVPNESCTEFCQHQQANGVFVNPRCVMQVTSCDQIEAARAKTCQ